MFEVAEAYERQMGRWSRQLAPLFVEFVGVRDEEKVLDVGCGTGSLAAVLAKITKASNIVGIDSSKPFIEYARTQTTDRRVTFEVGEAQNLPYAEKSFDRCLALLIINFIPDALKAAKEMRRVAKSGGVLGVAMWDGTGGNQFNDCMWDAAEALDPSVKRPSQGPRSYSSPGALNRLWQDAGLIEIEVDGLSIDCELTSFDELWGRYLEGSGPGGSYVCGLGDEHRTALKAKLREAVLGGRPDGPFSLQAKAWAVKGVVP